MKHTIDPSPMAMARSTGALWLVTIVAGLYAELFARSAVYVRGDPVATAARIGAAAPAYRLGFVADLVGTAAYLGVTLLLYELLRPVGRSAARAAAAFGVAGSAILAANLVVMFAPLVLVGSKGFEGLALPALRIHATGYNIALFFFAVQVALLGLLVLRATFLPRLLGILLLVEAVCNIAHCLGVFLDIGLIERIDTYVLLPGLAAEGGMTLWLVLAGVNAAKWRDQPRRPGRKQGAPVRHPGESRGLGG